MVVGQPGSVCSGFHIGNLELDCLIATDGVAKSVPLLSVGHAFVNAALGQTYPQRCDRDATLIENGQELCITSAALAE